MANLKRHAMHAACYAELIALLVAGPCSTADMGAASGLHVNTIRKLLAALRRRELVRIVEWEVDQQGVCRVPLYAFGKGPDKPRPPVKSKTLIQRDYRARVKDGLVRPRKSAVSSVFELGSRRA